MGQLAMDSFVTIINLIILALILIVIIVGIYVLFLAIKPLKIYIKKNS